MGSDPDEEAGQERVIRLAREALGGDVERIEEIAPGLGHRRFFRLRIAGGRAPSVIARVENAAAAPPVPPGIAPEPELEPIRAWLESRGLPVPMRHAFDPEAGIELLEDLGDTSLELAAASLQAPQRVALYAEACTLIARLQALEPPSPPIAAFERRLDAQLIATKANKLLEWTLPHALGRTALPAEREVVETAFAWIADALASAPQRLSHRDMKAANLHIRKRGQGQQLAMIDFQGAFLAPPEYDLVCLLRDSHVRLPESEVQEHLTRTRPSLPDAPPTEDFDRRFTLITLIRVGKDVSHYLHAADASGDRRYLGFVPTALENLGRAAAHAAAWDPLLERLADCISPLVTSNATWESEGEH